MGSLKKDQSVLAKNVEELKQAIDDAVIKVKVNLLYNYNTKLLCFFYCNYFRLDTTQIKIELFL